jgi:hypothetical protein
MPDWKVLVRERLGAMDSSAAGFAVSSSNEDAEIVIELAAHLEDVYDELREKGMSESDALSQALGGVGSWRGLAEKIHRAKVGEGIMNTRTKALWLPGLIGLTASMAWMMILQRASLRPSLPGPWLHSGLAFLWYFVWLISQPVFGAAAAYLSHRAGSERRTELIATLFPSIVMFGLWVVLVVFIVVTRYSHVSHQWPLVFAGVFLWSILPGFALLLGESLYTRTRKLATS